jgi:hypothetical protein
MPLLIGRERPFCDLDREIRVTMVSDCATFATVRRVDDGTGTDAVVLWTCPHFVVLARVSLAAVIVEVGPDRTLLNFVEKQAEIAIRLDGTKCDRREQPATDQWMRWALARASGGGETWCDRLDQGKHLFRR